MDQRLEREKAFHDQRFGDGNEPRHVVAKYYLLHQHMMKVYERPILTRCNGARLLEYGCGKGGKSFMWAEHGAEVVGIDISSEGIRVAQETAEAMGLSIEFYEMDAENMSFEDNSFDIITGRGILHHLDLVKAFGEISRVLKPRGVAIFWEPLGHNPLINLYRKATPRLRTEDEHPLLMKNIRCASRYFGGINTQFFHILSFLGIPFRNLELFPTLLRILINFDKTIMSWIPFVRRYSWSVILYLSEPKQ
jgi:SAM-dependent methyltransferase